MRLCTASSTPHDNFLELPRYLPKLNHGVLPLRNLHQLDLTKDLVGYNAPSLGMASCVVGVVGMSLLDTLACGVRLRWRWLDKHQPLIDIFTPLDISCTTLPISLHRCRSLSLSGLALRVPFYLCYTPVSKRRRDADVIERKCARCLSIYLEGRSADRSLQYFRT